MAQKQKETLEKSNVNGEALPNEKWFNEYLSKEEIQFIKKVFSNTGDQHHE